jgi:WD40 repeat protein
VLWDLRTRKVVRELTNATDGVVNELDFHPGGNMLAVTSSGQPALVWDVRSHSLLGRIGGQSNASVRSARFSPDGRLLATGHADGTISFWDVQNWERVAKPISAHEEGVITLTFSPDGRLLASAGTNDEIMLWEIESQRPLGGPLVGHNRPVLFLAFAPDSLTLVSGGDDRTVILWDPARRILLGRLLSGRGVAAHSIALAPAHRLLAVGTTAGVKLWDLESSDASAEALGPAETDITSVAFSHDGAVLATGAADGVIALWDVAARQPLGADRGPYDPLPPNRFSGQRGPITSLAFDPDGKRLASSSAKQSLYIWELQSGSPAAKEELAHPQFVSAVVFLHDGRALVSAGGDGVTIRSPADLSVTTGPFEGQAEVISLDYAPATKTMAVGRKDGVVTIWDAKAWEPRDTLALTPSSPVRGVAFRGDGQVLAMGTQQGDVWLWDLRANRVIGEPLSGHHSAVASLEFDFEGKKLLSADEEGAVIEWDVDPESWIDLACEKANRNLRLKEWKTYLGDEEYRPTCPSRPVRPDAPDYRPGPQIRPFEIEVSGERMGESKSITS